jgi:hypothetical protein
MPLNWRGRRSASIIGHWRCSAKEALSLGDTLKAEELDREPELKLGPAANAIERRAQLVAEAEGRDYEPLTQRGARVHAVRQAKAMFAEMRERLELARDAWAEAREEGQGHVSAGLAALRAAAGRQAKELDQDEIKQRLARIAGRELGEGDGHTFACPHSDQVGLKLGEGGQNVEEHFAHRIGRIVDRRTQGELDALFRELLCDCARIRDGSGETIQLWNDQHVAFPHGGQCLVETGTGAIGACQPVVGIDTVF